MWKWRRPRDSLPAMWNGVMSYGQPCPISSRILRCSSLVYLPAQPLQRLFSAGPVWAGRCIRRLGYMKFPSLSVQPLFTLTCWRSLCLYWILFMLSLIHELRSAATSHEYNAQFLAEIALLPIRCGGDPGRFAFDLYGCVCNGQNSLSGCDPHVARRRRCLVSES